jgi:hypothetical protein
VTDPETPAAIPEDPVEALRLAADAIEKASKRVLYDRSILPPEWYEMYGAVGEIMTSISNLATAAIDHMPNAMSGKEPFVDELGPAKSLEHVIGEWVVKTNSATFHLGLAAGQWMGARSSLSRIGVRVPPGGDA